MEEKDRLLQRILSLTTSAPWTENLRLNRESIRTLCEEGMLGRIRRMYLTGGGTSLYAAEVGRSYMERIAGIPAKQFPAIVSAIISRRTCSGRMSACSPFHRQGRPAPWKTVSGRRSERGHLTSSSPAPSTRGCPQRRAA